MPRLNYSASVDDLEIMAGSMNTKANELRDFFEGKVPNEYGAIMRAAFFYGAAAGIDQLLKLGRPEDAHFRVIYDCNRLMGGLVDGE